MNNNFPNYDWKEIYDEWYGHLSPPVKAEDGRKGVPIILENEKEILEYPSFVEASYHMNCHSSTLQYHEKNGSLFGGYKIRRKE